MADIRQQSPFFPPVAVVVIPTSDEAGTIGNMLDRLFLNVFPGIREWRMNVLVVDAHSADGTAKIVEEKIANDAVYAGLHLLSETSKDGIGAAYFKGFRYAMEKLSADVIIEFDADFQHPPESLPALLAEIHAGFDYIVGSRNMPGGTDERRSAGSGNMLSGKVRSGSNRSRFFLTKFGGWCARVILFFPGRYFSAVTDPTSGFKATRVKGFADRLDLDVSHLYSKKFGYKVQMLSETLNLDARYREIPLRFRKRAAGVSKFEAWGSETWGGTAAEILSACFRTRWHDPATRKFFRFAVVGAIGYGVNAIFLEITSTHVPEILAWTLSAEAAIVSNFIFNAVWTFGNERIDGMRRSTMRFLQFNLTSLGAILIQAGIGTAAVLHFGQEYHQRILFVVIVCVVVPYNWYMYTRVIWKKNISRAAFVDEP